jgi:metal transporter CNNM
VSQACVVSKLQLNPIRMAVVIPRPTKDLLAPLSASAKNEDALPRHGAPLWSASRGLNTRSTIEMGALDAHVDWTTDFLEAAQNDLDVPRHRKQSVIGIGCPKPIGIVTYEDILDALLQKTSLDEKDFFSRDNVVPPTKGRKEGDDNSVSSNHSIVRTRKSVPAYVQRLHAAFERGEKNKGILRRRNISGPAVGVDGVSALSGQGFDGANDRKIPSHADASNDCSSYTENSLGGFHGLNSSMECSNELSIPAPDQKVGFEISPIFPVPAMFTTAATSEVAGLYSDAVAPVASRSSCDTAAVQPRLRRVTPFSTQSTRSCGTKQAAEQTAFVKTPLLEIQDDVSSDRLDQDKPLAADLSKMFGQHTRGTTGALSARPESVSGQCEPDSHPYCASTVDPVPAAPSTHFAVTESPSGEKDTDVSKILLKNRQVEDARENEDNRPREESFHDDRTLLPSQRKRRERKSQSGGRRISLWF